MASLLKATQLAEQHASNRNTGQDDLFGLGTGPVTGHTEEFETHTVSFVVSGDWDDQERLHWEKETLGFYLEGHPISRYEKELSEIITVQLRHVKKERLRIAGYIENIRTRAGARGRTAEIRLDDRTSRMQLTLYPEVYDRYRPNLIKDRLIIICGEAIEDEPHGLLVPAAEDNVGPSEGFDSFGSENRRLECLYFGLWIHLHDVSFGRCHFGRPTSGVRG